MLVAFGSRRWRVGGSAVALLASWMLSAAQPSQAQTFNEALASAYVTNPQLNAARAQLRVTNEGVPQALAGYRPIVTGSVTAGTEHVNSRAPGQNNQVNYSHFGINPQTYGVTASQTLFNGFQTDNQVRQAEALVRVQRETLRTAEQNVLMAAATAYVDVVRDTALLDLQKNFVNVNNEQLRQTKDRFNVGEVTRTDVAQAEAQLAAARSQVSAAEAALALSKATFRQVIGRDAARLNPNTNVERLVPKTVQVAVNIGMSDHPQIRAAMYNVDSAAFAIAIAEAALYPTVSVSATAQRVVEQALPGTRQDQFSVIGRVTVPIYDAGVAPSRVRQAKEQLGQNRIQVDVVRDQIRALIVSNWSNLESQKAQIVAAQAQVSASEIALNGVREEARVGQRTTLDVLNALQTVLNARVTLVRAQHDRVVAAYTLVGSVGHLSVEPLGLNVAQYDPTLHYEQVRDLWHGLRTPSGD